MSKKVVVVVVLVVVFLALLVCGGGGAWWYFKNHGQAADVGPLPGRALALPADTALIGGFDTKGFFASASYKQIASGDIPGRAEKAPQEAEKTKKQIREGLEKGLVEAETKTGIRFDRDLERVVIAVSNVAAPTPEVAAIAFGRFDPAKIRSAVDASAKAEAAELGTKTIAGATVQVVVRPGQPSAALAVVDNERLVIGTETGVSTLLTNGAAHLKPLEGNASLLGLVRGIDPASSYWLAIDQALVTRAQKQATGDAPPPVPLPQNLTLFGKFEGGLTLAADMADDAAAKTVTEQLEGGLGMLKAQAEGNPEIQKVAGAKAVIDSISIKAAGKRVTLSISGSGGAALGGVIAALAMPSLMKTQAMLEGAGASIAPTDVATPEPQAEAPVVQQAPEPAAPRPRPARPATRATPRPAPRVTQAPPTTQAPAPAPTPHGPVRVGGDIQEPKKIKNVNPVYPPAAKRARSQGVVILECNISPEGRVTDVKVLRGVPLLDQAAIDAVSQWVYTPTLLNGTPVAVVMTVTVNFRLN